MLRKAALLGVMVCYGHICIELLALQRIGVFAREQRTSEGVGKTNGQERVSPDGTKVPFPGSAGPSEVAANIKTIAQQGTVAAHAGLHELAAGNFHIARLLQVKYEDPPAGWPASVGWPTAYLVAELDDLSGSPLASFALTRGGGFMALQATRDAKIARSLDLKKVASLVERRRGRVPITVEYEYFASVIEPGYSLFRPLVAARTENGVIYFNSQGEAFAEEGSALIKELGARGPEFKVPPGMKRLRSLGLW